MSVAFLFAGQGVDLARVIGEWTAASPHVRALLAVAARATGHSVARLTSGSGAALRDTACYQPTLTAVSVGVLLELRELGLTPDLVAGHSLGELAAAVAAEALSPEAAVELAAERGRAMAHAAELAPGGMAAIRARSRAEAEAAIARVAHAGALAIAAHNAPDEWVLAGAIDALRALPASLSPALLATSGAWHSPAMAPAREPYRAALARARLGAPAAIFVCNRTGAALDGDLADALAAQLTGPVQWAATMNTLLELGATTILTVGPAKALRSLARRNVGPGAMLLGTDTPADLEHLARLPA